MRHTVADTGVGIAPEYPSHIFEPFFTTKEALLAGGLRSRTGRPSLDESAEVAPRGGVGSEHRPELKIEGNLGIVVLNLGDARLAGTHPPCQVLLREVTALPERAHGISQRELGLHEGRFDVGQLEELGGAPDLPASLLEALAMSLAHDSSTFLNSAALRRHTAMMCAGVARVVF